jgi:hypothetical protein
MSQETQNSDANYEINETIVGLLQQILRALKPSTGTPLTSTPNILVVSISGASTATPINKTALAVKAALVQNISTNVVTLGSQANLAVGIGYLLNAASASASAGDTVTVVPPQGADYVDLSQIWFNQTGTGATLAVFYFQ